MAEIKKFKVFFIGGSADGKELIYNYDQGKCIELQIAPKGVFTWVDVNENKMTTTTEVYKKIDDVNSDTNYYMYVKQFGV